MELWPRNTPTTTLEIRGVASSSDFAQTLVKQSIPFHCNPLPDNYWRFVIKQESVASLERRPTARAHLKYAIVR